MTLKIQFEIIMIIKQDQPLNYIIDSFMIQLVNICNFKFWKILKPNNNHNYPTIIYNNFNIITYSFKLIHIFAFFKLNLLEENQFLSSIKLSGILNWKCSELFLK